MNLRKIILRINIQILLAGAVLNGCFFSMAFANEFRYDSKDKRDPFLSPGEASAVKRQLGPGELSLQGVIFDEGGASYVMVNGEIVKEGDQFAGLLLKKIETNSAIFAKENEEFKLYLREDDKPKEESEQGSEAGSGAKQAEGNGS